MSHTLEIVSGKLYSYGDNGSGQLGIGNTNRTENKQEVLTNTDSDNIPWISAKAGRLHSIAVKKDLSVWSWGDNSYGQIAKPIDIKNVAKPQKIDLPNLNLSKEIEINVGYYFSVVSQTSEKAYGWGEFENFTTGFVTKYRTPTELISDSADNRWFSINTGPKTILGYSIDLGSYFAVDWSGDLTSKEYVKFKDLKINEIFTLNDPSNRDRVLYKKIEPFSYGDGCCLINAICLHRTYRELLSSSPLGSKDKKIANYTVSEILNQQVRANVSASIVKAKEQYGVDFIFNSALSGRSSMTGFSDIDPWTMKGLFLVTGKNNLLDVILYDAIHFSDDLTSDYTTEDLVEKISARELFNSLPFTVVSPEHPIKIDTGFSKYLLNKSDYYIDYGSTYDPTLENINTGASGYGGPLYFFRKDRSKSFKFTNKNASGFIPYIGCIREIRDIEKTETYDKANTPYSVDWPTDTNNRIMVEDFIYTDPYLIKYDITSPIDINATTSSTTSVDAGFVDPYVKVQQTNSDSLSCDNLPDVSRLRLMYKCTLKKPQLLISGYPVTVLYNIGSYAQSIFEYLTATNTPSSETSKLFVGLYKSDLTEIYTSIKNMMKDKDSYTRGKQAFDKIAPLINDKFSNQFTYNSNNKVVLKTGKNTNSLMDKMNFSTLYYAANYNPPRATLYSGVSSIPYNRVRAFTAGKGTVATVKATITSGSITGVEITSSGSQYFTTPSITVSEPPTGGNKAILKTVIKNNEVSSIVILNRGSGYIDPPTIVIDEPQESINRLCKINMVGNWYNRFVADKTTQLEYFTFSGEPLLLTNDQGTQYSNLGVGNYTNGAYIRQYKTVLIKRIEYDANLYRTTVTLDKPFTINYIVGRVVTPPPYISPCYCCPCCGELLTPYLYFNNPFDLPSSLSTMDSIQL